MMPFMSFGALLFLLAIGWIKNKNSNNVQHILKISESTIIDLNSNTVQVH